MDSDAALRMRILFSPEKICPFQAVTIEYLDKIGSGLQDGVCINTYFKSTFSNISVLVQEPSSLFA